MTPLRQQIEAVDIVLGFGEAGLKRAGSRSTSEAELILGRLSAARDTLEWLRRNEREIKDALGAIAQGEKAAKVTEVLA